MMKAKDYYILMENIFYENLNDLKTILKSDSNLKEQIGNIVDDKKDIKITNFFKVLMNEDFIKLFEKFKNSKDFLNFFNLNKKQINEDFFPKEGEKLMINESAFIFFSIQAIMFLLFVLVHAFEPNINIGIVLGKISNFIEKKFKSS